MSNVQIDINGRQYFVGAEDGQEAEVQKLARYVDTQITNLAKSLGQIGDTRLFLMGCLVLADEIQETKKSLTQAEAELARLRDRLSPDKENARVTSLEKQLNETEDERNKLENETSSSIKEMALQLTKAAEKLEKLSQKIDKI